MCLAHLCGSHARKRSLLSGKDHPYMVMSAWGEHLWLKCQQPVVKSLACPFCGVLWQYIKPQITSHDNNPQHTDKSTKEDLRGRKGRVIVPVKVTLVTCRKTLKHLSTDGHEGRGVKNLQPNMKHQWKNSLFLLRWTTQASVAEGVIT